MPASTCCSYAPRMWSSLVADGVANLGVTGLDLLEGGAAPARDRRSGPITRVWPVRTDRGGAQRGELTNVPADFAGLRVATSHPNVTERYFTGHGVPVDVVRLRGSVEVAPKLGVADAVADLVSTGSTLMINGLRPVLPVLSSQAVLVGGPDRASTSTEVDTVVTALKSVLAGRRRRYLLLNASREAVPAITALIPGLEAPTVIPLAEDGMVAIHSVVERDEVWNLLPRLKAGGGRDILVLPIGQLVP